MRLRRHFARLAAITTLLGAAAGLVAATTPAASAAPAASQDGWVRIAHLSPQAPAMDMYLYPFGDPTHPVVLRDVTYGDVSAYLAVAPGQYSVAMRGFGAPASSTPALTSSFMISAQGAFTVAALGPDPGLRVEVLKDQLTTPGGHALVRVMQASLKEHLVSVSYGPDVLAHQLAFGLATSYVTVSPGKQTVHFTASDEHAAASVDLAGDSSTTIVVLDGSAGLKVDAVTDSVGSRVLPAGGANTGFGGTAAHPAGSPAPWLATIVAGILVTAAGAFALRRPRRGLLAR